MQMMQYMCTWGETATTIVRVRNTKRPGHKWHRLIRRLKRNDDYAYARNRNMKMARSLEFDLESARCCALFLMLNSVSCTQISYKRQQKDLQITKKRSTTSKWEQICL